MPWTHLQALVKIVNASLIPDTEDFLTVKERVKLVRLKPMVKR
jgi:hypothetical protein